MLLLDTIITFAPLIGYYSQYALIRDRQAVGSFSIDICGIVIVANILRIYFWFSSGFNTNLLIQSFLVIGMQVLTEQQKIMLLRLCINLGYKKDGQKQGFWRWDSFASFGINIVYLGIFLVLFSTVVGIITSIFVAQKIEPFGNIIGVLSLSIESTIGLPQLFMNQQKKSVEGLSIFMIITWFCGDLFKTVYFFYQNQPYQFIISGIIQLTVDIGILTQIMIFKNNKQYEEVGHHEVLNEQIEPSFIQNQVDGI